MISASVFDGVLRLSLISSTSDQYIYLGCQLDLSGGRYFKVVWLSMVDFAKHSFVHFRLTYVYILTSEAVV